jgi:uncharacterized membrane protein
MARIQQSIEVNVPVQTLYAQLMQFGNYPRIFENVESVQQTDHTHLHWTTKMADRPVVWDAAITKQEIDHCIAWKNINGVSNGSQVELQALSPDAAKATFTLDADPGQFPGLIAGDTEEEMAEHLRHDLTRLKDFVEAGGSRTDTSQDRQTSTRESIASISGSPTEVLEDEPNEAGPGTFGEANAAADARLSQGNPGGSTA